MDLWWIYILIFLAAAVLVAAVALIKRGTGLSRFALIGLSVFIVLREYSIGRFMRTEIDALQQKGLLTQEFLEGMLHIYRYCDLTGYLVYLSLLFVILVAVVSTRCDDKSKKSHKEVV